MGQTQYYGLSFFDFGDALNTPTNIQKEINRFVVVDKQLYGLYSIFGNGVIEGWTISDGGYDAEKGISANISSGSGIINYWAAQTDLPSIISNLNTNSVLDVYASATGSTIYDRVISFTASSIPLASEQYIKIGRIATGSNSILYIDNTVRDLIGFEEIIESQINNHKHRGSPTKIDLQEEVKNQLPGARIEGVDASKITSGTFNINRVPLVDHNQLENNGLLTHAALDSFVKTLSQSNKELLGEINSTNLIKTVLFLKYLYPSVDEYFINELAIIPGISSDSFIDFDSSTAHIDLNTHCISGYPAQAGVFSSVYWNSSFAFNNYYYLSEDYSDNGDIIIEDDEITLDRSSLYSSTVADFSDEQVGFVPSVVTISNDQEANIVTVNQDNRLEMGGGVEVAYYYTKTFTSPQVWKGSYDELSIKVRTLEEIHSAVYMYAVNGVDSNGIDIKKPSSNWVLLAKDEDATNLTEKVFDISEMDLDNVTKLVIWTAENFTFQIDDIIVRRTNMVAPIGTIRYRYQTQANVVFHSLFYNASTPEGTSLSVRIKTAASSDLLGRAQYSYPLNSGDVFALSGSAAEIEVRMYSNSLQTLSPTLDNIELRMMVDADFTGFTINTEEEWERGTFENVETVAETGTGNSDIILSSPINVGGKYFSKDGSVSEINSTNGPIMGLSGSRMLLSPNQSKNWSYSSAKGFDTVASVVRKHGKTFLIADTYNNRVIEVDSTGNFIKGIGSTYTSDTSKLYPVSAVYNSSDQILTVVFSQPVTVSDITKIYFHIGSSEVALTEDDTISSLRIASGKILNININDDTAARLTGVSSNLFIYFDSGSLTVSVQIPDGMKASANSIYSELYGFECFIGQFYYVENIYHPIFVNELDNGNWIILNSSIVDADYSQEDETNISVPSIIEFDPNDPSDTANKIQMSDIYFSDYSLGSIYEYNNNRFVVSGLVESSNTLNVSGDDLRNYYTNNGQSIPEETEFRAKAVDQLKSYAGGVYTFSRANSTKQIYYTSPDGLYPSDVSVFSNGDFLVAESSFYDASGRLIRLDAYGNLTWNYGGGVFNIISDAKVTSDDNIIISV